MTNQDIANALLNIATIKTAKGDNKFSIGAYTKAATFCEHLPNPITSLNLADTKGIGPKIAAHIQEFMDTGKIQFVIDNTNLLQSKHNIEELLKIEGIGEKTALKIYQSLNITTIDQLKLAIENNTISQCLKPKSIESIKKGIEYLATTRGRIRLDQGIELATSIYRYLKPYVQKIQICGSLRRSKSTVGDIDIAVIANPDVLRIFETMLIVDKIIDSGDKKSSIWINGVRVDCYIFTPENYESGIMHLTGSAEHNKQLRIIAKSKGLTLSQYGLFRQDSNIRLDNGTEQDIYNKLGYEWIPPEHREGTIEFDTYKIHIIPPSGNISNISYGHSHTPILLKHEDIISDFHIHSNWSDGKNSIESIVVHALSLGLKTIAITDHSQSLKIAHGLSIDRLLEQQQEINRCKQKFPQINILSGSEVDIKSDGTLDYPDHILNNLDIVIGSIHTATKQNVTNIYIKAIESGKLSIIGHITGRLINERMPHDMDIETILQTCKQYNVAIELNCQPNRLDADEQILKRCKHLDIKIALGSDAHDLSQIKYVQSYGLWTAKRAWITKHDLLDIKNIHLGNHP